MEDRTAQSIAVRIISNRLLSAFLRITFPSFHLIHGVCFKSSNVVGSVETDVNKGTEHTTGSEGSEYTTDSRHYVHLLILFFCPFTPSLHCPLRGLSRLKYWFQMSSSISWWSCISYHVILFAVDMVSVGKAPMWRRLSFLQLRLFSVFLSELCGKKFLKGDYSQNNISLKVKSND